MARTGLDASSFLGIKLKPVAPTNGQVYTYNSSTMLREPADSGSGTGTVTSVDVTTANGVSATGGPITTSGSFTFSLGDITPTSIGSATTATTQTPGDSSTKIATTAYVDNAVLGQNFKEAVKYATIAVLPAVNYVNGVSGVGATLTEVGFGALSIDGSTPSVGDRVLIKTQAATLQNGIYTVTVVGTAGSSFVLTRSTDTDQSSDWKTGDSVFVTAGGTLSTTTRAYTGATAPTLGTDAITFAQTAGQGSFTAGNGITITGVSIAINTAVTVDLSTAQALTNKTYNGNTWTSGTGTLTIAAAKVLTVSNSITLAGTDSTTMTFPTTSKTIAANDGTNWTIASQAIGDIAYATSTTAYGRLASVAAGSFLRSGGVGTAPTWSTATIPTTAGTSGNVLTSDGTNWTSAAPASVFWTAITATRVSNTTCTVVGDQTAIFKKGMVLKWQETGANKMAMVSIPSTVSGTTTITFIGDTMAATPDAGTFKYMGMDAFIVNFAIAGTIGAIATNVANAWYANEPYRVLGADLYTGTAGTTNSTTIDINIGGTTCFTTKPTLATTVAASPTPFTADNGTSFALNDKITIDVDAVQTTAAIDLYVKLYLVPTRYLFLT